ncbi:MAG: uroporphyrinogen decarboxylase family protein [Candidatus Omnitrophica bacterium]|nr:uroporphyrinogen decarboxylase family protein [Candidatus Omnitrophota bacterium]
MGFPGVSLADSEIKLAQQNYREHFRVVQTNVEIFSPDMAFPLMDLSVEANALGRYTVFPRRDSATVPKDHFDFREIDRMRRIDVAGDARVMGYVETVRQMTRELPGMIVKGAYVTGPYTLAALIMGADDAAMATILQPDDLARLCEFTTGVILKYNDLLVGAGVDVICVLEPTAVMLGPKQFRQFSSAYIRRITQRNAERGVCTVYHTCGNTMHLISGMLEAGVQGVSLDAKDAGVDLAKAAQIVPESAAVIGNISPTQTLLHGTPEEVRREVRELLGEMRPFPHFILSTGCDLPQEIPPDNIHAFMQAGREEWMK